MSEYVLSEVQMRALREYFELAMTAISDEEQHRLVFMEKPLRDMLRDLEPSHQGVRRGID